MSQEQKGGMGSTNLQVGTVHISTGLSVADVKEIAKDVFNSNFSTLTQDARDIANKRASELRDELMDLLASGKGNPNSFSQPEKQFALIEAQKSYALSGDEELRSTLVRTVIQISSEPERSLKSIILNESLKILPTLTSQQIHTVATVFLVKYVRISSAKNIASLSEKYGQFIGTRWATLNPGDGDFRHIVFSRCGTVEMTQRNFTNILKEAYPGLVAAGFAPDNLVDIFGSVNVSAQAIMPCLNDTEKVQIAAVDSKIIEEKAKVYNWNNEQVSAYTKKLEENVLDDDSIDRKITETGGPLSHIRDKWKLTAIKNVALTSVGIAVAHSFVGSQNPDIAELDIWL